MSFNLATILTEATLAAPDAPGLPDRRKPDHIPRA